MWAHICTECTEDILLFTGLGLFAGVCAGAFVMAAWLDAMNEFGRKDNEPK